MSTDALSSSGGGTTRVLMVDDEPNILSGYRRTLRGKFIVMTANSGAEGLTMLERALATGQGFPVIVSDMKMPQMDGAEFLSQAKQLQPDAVQMLLSGQADLESTIAAVNNGNLFRFLTKPCATEDLELALSAAFGQYQLVRAERDLLEKTLSGAVEVLTQVLALASPETFTRTQQVQHLVDSMAKTLKVRDWRLPLAAMLSQIGCLSVPPEVLHRARNGGELDDEEAQSYQRHPQAAQQLLQRIPRLEDVAAWVGDQPVRLPGSAEPDVPAPAGAAPGVPAPRSADPAQGAVPPEPNLLLRVALDFLASRDATSDPGAALGRLTASAVYPDAVLSALRRGAASLAPPSVLRDLTVEQVSVGMILDADVETLNGMVLVRKGELVTEMVAMRLANFARTAGIKEPLRCWAQPETTRL
jgi:CheY-like chemotaxis protein